jgi:hypothetical protein
MTTNESVLNIVTARSVAAQRPQPSPDPLDEQDTR